jgi:hypothetical protein
VVFGAKKQSLCCICSKGSAQGLYEAKLLYAYLLAVAAYTLERNVTVHQGKQRVVAAAAYVYTRMDVCAALTHQDVAGEYELAVGALYAQTLGLGIAAVFGRTYTFFMCHV